jgi:pseudaminic acid biosynthesis-associated methylase
MTKTYRTEQEAFWAGSFGEGYLERNDGSEFIASNLSLFNKILAGAKPISSVLELGANIGLNLRAIGLMFPKANLIGVEINEKAVKKLEKVNNTEAVHGSIFDYEAKETVDLSFTRGVLIHINPKELERVYDCLYKSSHRYILVVEYYNPSPVSIPYRGESDKLFKRDFAGEIMDRFEDVELVDYGFVYHRDPKFPQDDVSWFLMEKKL